MGLNRAKAANDLLVSDLVPGKRGNRTSEQGRISMSGYPTNRELARFPLDGLKSVKLPVYVRF